MSAEPQILARNRQWCVDFWFRVRARRRLHQVMKEPKITPGAIEVHDYVDHDPLVQSGMVKFHLLMAMADDARPHLRPTLRDWKRRGRS